MRSFSTSARGRRTALTAFGLASILTLTACGGTSDAPEEDAASASSASSEAAEPSPESTESEEAEETADFQTAFEPGVAGTLNSVPNDLGLEEVEESPDNTVEVLGTRFAVTQTARVDAVPGKLAEQIAPMVFDYADEVSAADGEALYVAVVQASDARHAFEGEAPETTTTFRVNGDPVDVGVPPLAAGDQATVVVSAPEDAEPEDVTLEVVQDEAAQEISLVDGSRTASDVEHIYERPTSVAVEEGHDWDVSFTGFTGKTEHLSGQIEGAEILPALPKQGWATSGNVFLGLDVSTNKLNSPDEDESMITLELPDGTTQRWLDDPSDLQYRFKDRVWFEIPADATEATAKVDVIVKAGIKDPETLDSLEVPLTFER